MKKIICTTLLVLFSLLLTACGSTTQVKYEAIEIKDIIITQESKMTYNISFNISQEINNEKIYFTRNDSLKSSDTEVSVTKDNLNYTFKNTVEIKDYFIYVVYNDITVKHGVTIPDFSPTITTVEAAKTYVKIDYGFNSSSSWSAFCDPTGKNIYRSSKSTFDDTATKIISNENIVTTESNDSNPSSEEPFYFIVLKSKNGNVTFISNALTTSENIIETISLDLKTIGLKPILEANVVFNELITDSFELKVKSGSEEYTTSGVESNNVVTYNFDLSNLTKLGMWYDITLVNSITGNDIVILDESANMDASVTTDDTKYTFKEWGNFLKVNAESFIADDVDFSSIELKDKDGIPTLILKATSSNDFTIEINSIEESPTKNGNTYTFECNLSNLNIPGNWYDINYKIEGVSKTIDATLANFDNKITVDEKVYEFKEWGNALKVQFSSEVKIEVDFTAITLTDENGVPTLTIVATSTEDFNITIRYSVDGEKTDLVTLSPIKNVNTYTFTYDLSNMIVAGDWHDLVYTNSLGTFDIPEGIVDESQTITIADRTYKFEKWAGQKIAFSNN